MNYRTKLKILTAVTLIGLAIVAFIVISGLTAIDQAQETAHRRKAYVTDLLEIKASAISTIMLDPSLPETMQIFSDADTSIKSHSDIVVKTIVRQEIVQEFKNIMQGWQTYEQQSEQIIRLAKNDFSTANQKITPLYKQEFKPFQLKLEQFIADRQQDAKVAIEKAKEISRAIYWKIIVLLSIVSAANIVVVFNLARSLRNGLSAIQEKLLPLKRGDLTERLPINGRDELSEISAGINEFINELQNIVLNVREESRQLVSASSQLALAAKQVLDSSNHQSEATSSVAATVEEFAVSIDHVSGNAADAEHLATEYGNLSQQGGADVQTAIEEIRRIEQAVNNAVLKMQVLGDQAREISSIVNVIKDVADQTNLLALNAAIEAARAGESGRGFSVVADEVRNLAKRTAKSAQEITTMISSIQTHTETAANVMQQGNECVITGVKQAELVGQSMLQINESSVSVLKAIADISFALREQRSASNEIARNVEYISHMTEENGTAVFQVSSAALQVEKLADDLVRSVERFQV